MLIVRRKWKRLPASSDRVIDRNLKALCKILKKYSVIYVHDLKNIHRKNSKLVKYKRNGKVISYKRKGKLVADRVRGLYKDDAIKLDVPKSRQNRAWQIVKSALHEALELWHDGKIPRKEKEILGWEEDLFDRITDDQKSYVWSLLPPVPRRPSGKS